MGQVASFCELKKNELKPQCIEQTRERCKDPRLRDVPVCRLLQNETQQQQQQQQQSLQTKLEGGYIALIVIGSILLALFIAYFIYALIQNEKFGRQLDEFDARVARASGV